MINYEIFSELLDIKNKKISDVCKATGIARATFIDWQKGKYSPKNDKLKKIANYFEVPLSTFTDEDTQQEGFSQTDLLLARELNHSDKVDLIKDIMKIQKEKDIEIIELITKKILEGQS